MNDFLPLDLLTTMTLLPVIGAVVVFLMPKGQERMARWTALLVSLVVMVRAIGVF